MQQNFVPARHVSDVCSLDKRYLPDQLEEHIDLKSVFVVYLDIIATMRMDPEISGYAKSPFFHDNERALDVSLTVLSSQL